MATLTIIGKPIEFDKDNHMKDASAWTEEIAAELAREECIALTDRHWAVIRYMRQDFQDTGAAPNIRRITKHGGVDTKELYQLFPKGPAKKAARIAGLPKPKGCI